MTAVETLDHWRKLSGLLGARGYRLWQMQYDTTDPEGFHAWFCRAGRPDVELVTYNGDVCEAILRYPTQHG